MTKLTPRANEFENRPLVAAIRIGIALFVLVDLILFLQLRQEDSPISAREIQSEKFKSGDLKDVLDKDFGAVGAVDLDKSHSTRPKAKGKRSTTPPAPQAFTAPQDHSSSEGSTVEAPSGGSTTGSGGTSSGSTGGTVPGGSTGATPSDDDSSGGTPPAGGGGGGGDEVPPGDGSGGDSGSDSGGSGGGGGGGGAGP